MKIVCVAADLIPNGLGGAEVHAIEVIRRLATKNEITVFVGEVASIKTTLPANVTVIPIQYPRIPNLFGLSYIQFGYPQIKKYLSTHPFDIVWAKQCFPQAVVAAKIKRDFRRPLYITAQNPYLLTEELVMKGRFLRPFQAFFALFANHMISQSFKNADIVAAVSRYSHEASVAFGAKKTVIIPNGYDDKTMKPANRNENAVFTMITTSSLIPRNGIDIVIKAVNLLPLTKPWKLLIAGDGPERSHLEQLAVGNGNIQFLGRVSNTDIPDLVRNSDIFIRPSRSEGFGVSFIEAMACSVPIIGTPVGGIPDFLIPDKTGLSVPVNNVTALTHAISKLMHDQKLSHTLAKNALKFVSKRYRWDIIADKVEQTMLGLITHHSQLKTLIVTPIYPPEIGGPATYVPEVAKRLNASVIAFSNFSPDVKKTIKSSSGVKFISVKGNALIRQSKLLSAVWNQLKHHDVLYIQGTVVVGLSAFLGRLMGKRVVIKFVGDEVWETYRQHSRSECSLEDFYQSNPHSLLLCIHRSILKAAHQVVVPSTYLKDFLVKYHGLHPNHISVIPNATEIPQTIKRSNYQTTKLVFIGRLVPWKNIDEIIQAVSIARKTHPWKLVIVGDGPMRLSLPKLPFVIYKGQLSKETTLKEITSSRALILYSSYEGHPHTVLEAHALGIPTIVSDISPHQDIGSYLRVPLHNPEKLAEAINSLQSNTIPTSPMPPTWSDHLDKLITLLQR